LDRPAQGENPGTHELAISNFGAASTGERIAGSLVG
jgi:hypothetical protein